jgi:hypothetical protein
MLREKFVGIVTCISRLAFALAGLLAVSGTSFAAAPAEVARDWGLLGLWRRDCTAKPTVSDPDLRFLVRNRTLYYDRNWGSGHDSSIVTSAKITANGGIDMVVRFPSLSQTREWINVKEDDGRIRAVMNRNVDTNEYSIRDGKIVSNGNTPTLQTHCR